MADIRIKPSQSVIQFTGSSGNLEAVIALDNMGQLILSSSQNVVFGPGKNDIYVGDGTSSANIIFDKDGAIKSEPGSGAQITLGSNVTPIVITGSTINMSGGNVSLGTFTASNAQINGGSFTGSIKTTAISTSVVSSSEAWLDRALINNFTSSNLILQPDGNIFFNDIFTAIPGILATGSIDTSSLGVTIGTVNGDAFRIVSGSTNYTFIAATSGAIPPDTSSLQTYYFVKGTYSPATPGTVATATFDTGALSPGMGDLAGDYFRIISASAVYTFIASDQTPIPPDAGTTYYFETGSVTTSSYVNLSNKINSALGSTLVTSSISSQFFILNTSFTGSRYNGMLMQSGSTNTTIAFFADGTNFSPAFSSSVFPSLSNKINSILGPTLVTSSINGVLFTISGSSTGSYANGILFQTGSGASFSTLFTLGGGKNYSASYLDQGGSIYMDNLGNIVIDSISGSVYLAKNKQDVYLGDGTSSANLIFDVAGAIKGETGKNIAVTIGSTDTQVIVTGSLVNIGTYTSSYAKINDGNITASAIRSNDGLFVSTSLSSSTVVTNTITATSSSFGLISGSRLNLNNNSGIYFTGSNPTLGASIAVDNLGNLNLDSVSGSVFFGKGNGDVYLGDGTGSSNLIFDVDGAIKGNPGVTLTVGSSSANLLLTASTLNIQPGGGQVTFGGNIINSGSVVGSRLTGSFTGSFTGDGSGLTNINISSSNTSGSFTGSFVGTGSLRLQTGSVGLSLEVASDFLKFTSGSTTNLIAQQVAGTTSMSFAFNTGSAIGGQGATFDVKGTAVIMNPQGNFYSENLRLPASPGGFSSIVMNGPVSGSGTQPGVWSLVVSPSSSATGNSFALRHNQTDVINVYTSSLVQITSPSGSILSPTQSAVPSFPGVDGQFLFGTVTGQPVMFVWMSGRWRSSSLA
jgi:hypothetical protein